MLNFFEEAGVSLSMDGDRLKVEGLKQLPPDQAQEIRQKIQENRGQIISELQIPEPRPAGLGQKYEQLWHQTWRLADWCDDPNAAPLDERLKYLPELEALQDQMAAICADRTDKPEPAPGKEVYYILESAEKIQPTKLKRSEALEVVASILENSDIKIKKQKRREAERMGREIKLALMATPKEKRVEAVRDAAWITGLTEDGHPVTKEDTLPTTLTRAVKKQTPEPCPARCKRTGVCYGKTYYTGKPGRGVMCTPGNCKYEERKGVKK